MLISKVSWLFSNFWVLPSISPPFPLSFGYSCQGLIILTSKTVVPYFSSEFALLQLPTIESLYAFSIRLMSDLLSEICSPFRYLQTMNKAPFNLPLVKLIKVRFPSFSLKAMLPISNPSCSSFSRLQPLTVFQPPFWSVHARTGDNFMMQLWNHLSGPVTNKGIRLRACTFALDSSSKTPVIDHD